MNKESVTYYKVARDYKPEDQSEHNCLCVRVGDIIEVDQPAHQTNGDWMSGRLQRTGDEGWFPSDCVEKQRPTPMPRNHSPRHQFDMVYFRMPIICSHCTDYIWGEGEVGVKCSSCCLFFHTSCQHLVSIPCKRRLSINYDYIETYSEPQRVEEWDIYEVKKWMAVVNLHRYSEMFSNHNVTGEKLLQLDENKIRNMNIKDDFHIKAILGSIDSLRRSQEIGMAQVVPSMAVDGARHHWSVYSFTSMQLCHTCNEYLHGIVQQGFQCQVCGLCCHRKCSSLNIQPCDVESARGLRRSSFNSVSMFGRSLESFCGVPPVLIHCVTSLESRGSELLTFYRKTPATTEVHMLKNMFDKNASNLLNLDINLSEGSVVGGILKKFLRDLPDPVIPEDFYASFIRLDEENRNELVRSLPPIHKTTLNFLILHLRKDPPANLKKLARIFDQIFMRPPWKKIMDIIDNSKIQTRTVELLLKMKDDDLPPHLQTVISGPSIDLAPWFWANVNREEVNEMMQNTPDGTYLVRNSTNKEENAPYTLTLRKSGKNMLLKIYYSFGKYGLMEPLELNSVEELIHFYSHHSLVKFNSNLDLKLQYPILKPIERETKYNIAELRLEFKILCERHSKIEAELENLHAEEEKLSEEFKMKQVAINAYNQIISMYNEQLDTTIEFISSISSGEIKNHSKLNSETLRRKLNEMRNVVNDLESELEQDDEELVAMRSKLEGKKKEMTKCSKDKDSKEQLLHKCGETPENIILIQEGSEVISTETVPHLNVSLWLVANCDRIHAEELLQTKPVGSFLIRPKDDAPYALSIVSPDKDGQNSKVMHCLINKMESGYGFAEPFYIHNTLLDLVLHYKDTSLIEHNDLLNVNLEHPVFYKIPSQHIP